MADTVTTRSFADIAKALQAKGAKAAKPADDRNKPSITVKGKTITVTLTVDEDREYPVSSTGKSFIVCPPVAYSVEGKPYKVALNVYVPNPDAEKA